MSKDDPETNLITDETNKGRGYFAKVPRIVLALCDSVYEVALWVTYKDIAGDTPNGYCEVTTQGIAALSMMSMGKVAECRKSLIEKGLLIGQIIRTDKDGLPRWLITIPNMDDRNFRWCQEYRYTNQRVEYKNDQKGDMRSVPAAIASRTCAWCGDQFYPKGTKSRRCDVCSEKATLERKRFFKELGPIDRMNGKCAYCESILDLEYHDETKILGKVIILCRDCHDKAERIVSYTERTEKRKRELYGQ